MKAWFQRFMSGRYGVDPFSQFLSTAALILVILGLFLPGPLRLLGWLGWAALIYSYYRIFSRNIPKRAAENRWFLAQRYAVQQRFASARTRFAQRKVTKNGGVPGPSVTWFSRLKRSCSAASSPASVSIDHACANGPPVMTG